jgi:hypothetical protein
MNTSADLSAAACAVRLKHKFGSRFSSHQMAPLSTSEPSNMSGGKD